MDLNKLRTFTVVAECENISRAAKKLYRTQPAISNQLKDLENETNLVLFERKNSRIYLTQEGRTLYRKARESFMELDDLVIRMKEEKKTVEGLIRIAVQIDTVVFLLPRIIREFKKEFPRVRFEVVPSEYGVIEDLLLTSKVDFALNVLFTKKEFFETQPFLTFSRSLVASPDYLDHAPAVENIPDLLKLDLVGYGSGIDDFRFWLKKNGYSKYISAFEKQPMSVSVNDAHTLNEMLIAGVGAGFAFDNMAGLKTFKKEKLKALFPDLKPMLVTVDIAYKKTRNESYINEAFRDFVLLNRHKLQF